MHTKIAFSVSTCIIAFILSLSTPIYAQDKIDKIDDSTPNQINEEFRKVRAATTQARGSLTGGTTGQYLTKASSTNFDTTWATLKTYETSLFNTFGGNGAQGAITVSGATNFSSIDSSNAGVAQYTSLIINAGQTLTIDTRYAIIAVSGDCTIHGTIKASGGAGGASGMKNGAVGGVSGCTDGQLKASKLRIGLSLACSGAGSPAEDGAGAGWVGGTANATPSLASGYAAPSFYTTMVTAVLTQNGYLDIGALIAAGGGGGGGMHAGSYDGGDGGGIIYIEVAGALIFDGALTAVGGAAAGPGGGGVIILRAKTITTNTGSVNVAGGSQSGCNGGAGYSAIVEI